MTGSILNSYKKVEEWSLEIWKILQVIRVVCFANIRYSIQAITKSYSSYPHLPNGDAETESAYKKARSHLIDQSFDELQGKVINWTRSTKPVAPLIVPRDGNSLCHSVSVLTCGVPDQTLLFRRSLHSTLKSHMDPNSPLYSRWSQFIMKCCDEFGRDYTNEGLRQEWAKICDTASPTPIDNPDTPNNLPTSFHPLQQFHIYVMALICRRVVVVSSLQEGGFKSSIYLPLDIPVEECVRSPLYLAYRHGHFAPLVFVDEFDAGSRFGDLCFPIVDSGLEPYEIPFLFREEDGLLLLEKYARVTTIGYTTRDNFVEVPALRVLGPEYWSMMKVSKSGVDPNTVISTCFNGLDEHRNPADVFNVWKRVIELQHKLGKASRLNLSSGSAQPLSGSVQPSDEVDDDEIDGDYPVINLVDPYLSQAMNPDLIGQAVKPYSLQINERVQLSDDPPHLRSLPTRGDVGTDRANPYPPLQRRSPVDGNYWHEPAVPISLEGMFTDSIASGMDPGQIQTDQRQPSFQTYAGGYSINQTSKDQIKIFRPDKVSLFIFSLETDGCNPMTFRLEKTGVKPEDPVNLKLPENSANINLSYSATQREELDIKLSVFFDQFQLKITKPASVKTNDLSVPHGAEAFASVPMSEDCLFYDYLDNPSKCRTAGCMGRAVKQNRNLCNSCHASWVEAMEQSEDSTTFSYFDSMSSVASREGMPCKNRSCRRQGERRYYGFCELCYHTPSDKWR